MHWTVERRYTEFYNLEAKLTAFHPMSEFEDAKLPPRPKLFSGKGLDVLQAKKRPFEEYLKCLLQKPSLKNSDILFTFLTSSEEFTEAATSHLGLAKMIKNVPMKLTKGSFTYNVRTFRDCWTPAFTQPHVKTAWSAFWATPLTRILLRGRHK